MAVESPKSKEKLNNITHAVRASQAVLQYGVGAMIDFPDQTLMTAAPEYWSETVVKIHDERFERALKVHYFGMPGGKDRDEFREGISYVRFPEWYFCPRCRKFQPIQKWYAEYRQKASPKNLDNDPNMVRHMQCTACRQDLVVARIVTVCENGHINDFPWIKWVHRRSRFGPREICANPSLTFKTGTSASEGLEGLVITCESCGASTTLKGAFDPDIFEELDKKNGRDDFRCDGNHPQKHLKEKCCKYPKAIQRGSSSAYFPVTLSSLVIPPYAEKLTENIEKSSVFQKCLAVIADEDSETRIDKIQKRLSKWAHDISVEIGATDAQVEAVLHRKWLEEAYVDNYAGSVKYRAEEYEALTGSAGGSTSLSDFSRESTDITSYGLPYLKGISLVNKIREVRALIGFTRLSPSANVNSSGDPHFVSVKEPETDWYPAYEVRGEGIFLDFSPEAIERWVTENPAVSERVNLINSAYADSFMGKQRPRVVKPKFVLLHTLAHLLIKQLSFECGYSIASLRERIYCGEAADGKEMSGIFIYTASGDSEGTLGGLVRQGRPDSFGHIFGKAVENAKFCSNDPVCILSRGQGRDSLNLAACHACTLIPETSCEEYNVFLDRGLLVGTFEDKNIGFFSE